MKVIKLTESIDKAIAIKQAQELLAENPDAEAVIYGWQQGKEIVYVPPFAVTEKELKNEYERRGAVYALHQGRKQRLNASFTFKRMKEYPLVEAITDMMKYYPNIPEDKFMSYIELDPTYKKGSDKAGTYGKWILTLANADKIDNIGHMKDLLTRFEEHKNELVNKDISRYKSMQEVEDMLNNEASYKEKTHRQEVRQRQQERSKADIDKDAEKIYEDSDWTIYIPKTYAASCKLGQGSKWCTASTESDYYYNYYKEQFGGDYYILISKKNPNEKYQFHFESGQFMDKDDREIDIDRFFKNNPNVKEVLIGRRKEVMEKELAELIEEDGMLKISVDDFVDKYNEESHSRDEVSGEFVEKVLNGDISEYSLSWEFPYPDEYTLQEIYDLYVNDENKKTLSELGVTDMEDLPEDVHDALNYAYSDGELVGTESAVFNDALRALTDIAPNGTEAGIDYEGNITIKVNDKDALSEWLVGHSAGEGVKGDITSYLGTHYSLWEPRYGWDGFDKDAFNERLSDELYEVQQNRGE